MAGNEFDALEGGAKPAESNEYDSILNDQRSSDQSAMRQSAIIASGTTPERSASVIKLAERTGIPKETVDRNFDQVRKRVEVDYNDYDAMLQQSPKLSQWLKDGENFSVAKDDLENLGVLEWMLTAPQRAFKQGVAQVEFGNLRHQSIMRDLSSDEQARLGELRGEMSKGGSLGAETWFGKALTGGAQQIPQLFSGLMAGAKTGLPISGVFATSAAIAGQVGPQVALPEEIITVPAAAALGYYIGSTTGSAQFTFQQESGHAYEEFSQFKDELGRPLDRDVARVAAIAAGAINGGLEVFQLHTIMRTIPGADKLFGAATRAAVTDALKQPTVRAALKNLALGYGKTMTTETLTEVAQRAVTIMSGEIGKAVDKTSNAKGRGAVDIAADLANEAIESAQAFTYIIAPGHVARLGQESIQIREARKQEALFSALGEGVSQSKTFQRLPEKLQEFVAHATKDGPIENVYVPVESWVQFWQGQNVDPAKAAGEVLGDTKTFDDAVRSGEDMAIPMSRYATRLAPTEANKFFSRELRLAPDEMNAREADDLEKHMAEQEKAAMAQQDAAVAEDVHAQAATQIADSVSQKLVAAGVEEGTAKAYAATYGAAFRSFGERAGVDPAALYEKYGLKINRQDSPSNPGDTSMSQSGAMQRFESMFPRAGDQVDGRTVRKDVPNTSSISASFLNYETMPGVREIPISAFDQEYVNGIRSDEHKLSDRTQKLAGEIAHSKELNPLIVGVDAKGLYIVEGSHRFDALIKSGAQSIPALVVIDKDEVSLDQSLSEFPPTIPVDGQDRKTMNASGAPIANNVQAIEAFWRWFGDSKVVDGDGRPLVVYHGTGAKFSTFNKKKSTQGILWFTTNREAIEADEVGAQGKGRIMSMYAKIDSPAGWDQYNNLMLAQFKGEGLDGAMLTSGAGFDGFVFESSQFKSLDNRGTFDPSSPNILSQTDPIEEEMNRALAGDTKQGDTARGRIRFGQDRKFDIDLLKNSNLSTFIHESGHFWLEVLGDIASELRIAPAEKLNAKQAKMLADYDTVLKWLGVTDRSGIKVDQHEKFARGVEAYMMEGNAPSAELRQVFARFRAWLLSIYRSLAKLNVELTPEVRDVMGRMLATDQEIEAAQNEAHVAPMFTDAKSAGMSEIEFGAYKDRVQTASDKAREELQAKLLKTLTREREQWWKSEREKERKDVAADVYARKEYIALQVLQRDEMPNGDALPYDLQRVKLDRKALDTAYGDDFWKSLPRGTTGANGVNANVAAEMFGFASGDDLITSLKTTRPMKATIEAETDVRMRDKHGDVLVDGSMLDAARAAVQNDERVKVIEAELRALNKLQRESAKAVAAERKQAGQVRAEGVGAIDRLLPPLQAIRDMAGRRIAGMRVRDIRPGAFLTAARRAGLEALKAAASGSYTAAISLKRRELFNVELYRQATRAVDEVEQTVDYMHKFGEARTRGRIAKAGQDYLDQIDGFLDRYEFARVPLKTLDRRKALVEWVAAKEKAGEPVNLPDDVLLETRINYKDMHVEELRGVRDSVKHIEHLSRLKNKLLTAKRNKELNEVVDEIRDSIEKHSKGAREKQIETRLPTTEAGRLVSGWFGSHRKLSSFIRQMDGFKDGGALWEYVMRPLNAAADAEAVMNREATEELNKVFSAYKGKDISDLYVKRSVKAAGVSLTKMARLMIALNWGNADSRVKVMDGYKWNEEQVRAILDTLDERDWKFVQGIWDTINSYWPKIEAKEKRVNGVAPEKVQADPVMTAFGEMTGGYFPLKYDDRQAPKAHGHRVEELAKQMMTGGFGKSTTRRGHTKERVEGVDLPIRLDFGVIFEHIAQVTHDLSHHEALIDVNRVLTSKGVQGAMLEHYGDVVYKQISKSVEDIAAGDIPAMGSFEKALGWLRSGVTIAGMGWNISTSLMQPFGLSQSIVRVGPKWVARGLSRWLRDAASMENTATWIKDVSPMMRNRMDTQLREINEIRQQIGVNTGKLSGWVDAALRTVTLDTVNKQAVADSYFWLIYKGQQIADIPTWLGAYEKALGDKTNDEERAIALADQAVLDSQGGGQMKDLAGIQRGGPLLKLWTAFYSYFNVTYNLTVESAKSGSFKDPVHLGRFAVDMLLLYTVPATLGFLMKNAMTGPDDDDKFWEKLIRENASYLFGIMVGLREVGSVIQGYAGYEGPAGARFFSSIAKLIKQTEQGETDGAFWRALNDTAGILLHYPAGQVKRSTEGLAAMLDGETRNPLALLVGPQKDK